MRYLVPVLLLTLAYVVFWFKGNAKAVYGIDWSPMRWWLCTSLATNYLSLSAWWRLCEIESGNVWRAGVICGICGLVVDLCLNSYFFGVNWRGVIALLLCALASTIVHN
jgi:hypothetical protein